MQAAAIYGAVAWGVTEVLVTVVDQLFLPQWVSTLAVIFFVVGFPVAMFLSWTFDFTTEGIRRTDIRSKRGTASILASMVLLIAGTAGLFLLIKPGLQEREEARPSAPVVAANSVAVLPFSSAGVNTDEANLIEGLADELRDQLARVSGMRIAARSSSIAASEQGLDAYSMSGKLGVARIVEGNVRRQGNMLRISVQLIDGASGLTEWSQTFERGPRELLSVQQAIADAVVANVLPDVGETTTEPATRNTTANELMLLARHYETQMRQREVVDQAQLLEAVRLYREAIKADPESALAHSRLAGALMYLGDLDAAESPIFKALAIDPNLSEIQNTVGEFHFARGLVADAGKAWRRATELNPNNPEALANYAQWRWLKVDVEEARVLFRRALELDPLNLERYAALGLFLLSENFFDETRALLVRIDQLFEGAPAYRVKADLLDRLGEVDRSIAWTIRARDLEPDNPDHVWKLAEYYADIGDFETAIRLDPGGIGILFKMRQFDDVIDAAEFAMIDQPQNLWIRAILAMSYNATGRHESAIHVLKDTGIPEAVFSGWRTYEESYAYQAMENAAYALGELEFARELARFMEVEEGGRLGYHFFVTLYHACDHAILGQDDLAREDLRRAQNGLHLVVDPYLKDVPCFERFKDDPVYLETVRYFDEFRERIRERLPATLAEFGVSL